MMSAVTVMPVQSTPIHTAYMAKHLQPRWQTHFQPRQRVTIGACWLDKGVMMSSTPPSPLNHEIHSIPLLCIGFEVCSVIFLVSFEFLTHMA